MRVGRIGQLYRGWGAIEAVYEKNQTSRFPVFQVLDDNSVLVQSEFIFRLSGVSTQNLTDESEIDLDFPVHVVGNFTYTTALGTQKTILDARRVSDSEMQEWAGELLKINPPPQKKKQ